MSVIIKMLQDLEQRQKPESETTPLQPKGEFVRPQVQYQSAPKSRTPVYLAALALMFISALWYGVSTYQQIQSGIAPQVATINSEPIALDTLLTSDVSTIVDANSVVQNDVALNVIPQNTIAPAFVIEESIIGESNNVESAALTPQASVPIAQSEALASRSTTLANNDDVAQELTSTVATIQQQISPVDTFTEDAIEADLPIITAVVSDKSIKNQSISVQPVKPTPAITTNTDSSKMMVKEVVFTKPQMAQIQYQKAVDAEKNQRVDDAASFYLEAIILQPDLHKARKSLVAIYYAQNNTTTAMRLLESGISMFPSEWEFYVILSRIQTETKAYENASTTLAMIPDSAQWARDKWVAQTELAQSTQNFVLAEQAYRNLLLSESTQARWWMGLGYALDSQKKYVPAAQAYRSALSYEGLSTSALTFIETRLAQLGENR